MYWFCELEQYDIYELVINIHLEDFKCLKKMFQSVIYDKSKWILYVLLYRIF